MMTTIFKEDQNEDNMFDKEDQNDDNIFDKEDQTCRPLSDPREELPPHLALNEK